MNTTKELGKEEITDMVCSIWEPLSAAQRRMIAQHLTFKQFKKNEIIYKEDEQPLLMMCLIQGKVKIFKEGMGRCQIVRVVKPQEMFGYSAFFAHECYKTNAMAFESSIVAFIPMNIITHLMRDCHGLTQAIVNHLSTALGKSDDRIINLTQKHIRGRLAEALIFLKDYYGVADDRCTLNISLSREDLANLSNMTTSNAIRTLSSFASEKLIAIDGRKIKILEEEELLKVSRNG
ncbi:MAG: Crp/Fnr family transcriptional regulator [Prevotella sp.]|nr:Crp/Fnr family transcriptional regulator [Prevotella sp.]